jgi:hypothetical protein
MNTLIDALMLIVAQLPRKDLWVPNLWVVDAVMFSLVVGSVMYVRSTHWALVTVYSGFMFTVLLRLCRSMFWRKYSHFIGGNEEKERV